MNTNTYIYKNKNNDKTPFQVILMQMDYGIE